MIEDHFEIAQSFELSTGKREYGKVLYEKQCGFAHYIDHGKKPHYLVKLWMLPGHMYYLVRNSGDGSRFTLFSKREIDEGDNVVFRNPIGQGVISEKLKTHLEVQFTFPMQRIFMSLFPIPVH